MILLLIIGGTLFFFFLSGALFDKNQRFTLKTVQVESKGFWKDKKELLCDILRLKPGTTNLFAVDSGEMRVRLLQRASSVKYVKIIKILPDTIRFEILERLPVARINSPKSQLLIDSESILLKRDECMDIGSSLPVIKGLPGIVNYPPGSKITQYEQAVELLMLSRTRYPEITVAGILVRNDHLICAIHYKENRKKSDVYRVIFPMKNLPQRVRALIAVLEKLQAVRDPRHDIDMRFDGQAVIKKHF